MDMEKKKNKTDKERLVTRTDVQDTPAFGPEDRPPHLQSQRLLLGWSQETVGPSQPCYLGCCVQASGPCPAATSMASQRAQSCRGRAGAMVK